MTEGSRVLAEFSASEMHQILMRWLKVYRPEVWRIARTRGFEVHFDLDGDPPELTWRLVRKA